MDDGRSYEEFRNIDLWTFSTVLFQENFQPNENSRIQKRNKLKREQ